MENNNKQTKSTGKTALIVFLLLVTIVSLILATYAWAKYTDTFNGEATAQVAKWNVNGTLGSSMYSKTFEHVVAQRVAPGTNGSIDAKLDVTGTEVDVKYTVTLLKVEPVEGGTIPKNLVLKDSNNTVIFEKGALVEEPAGDPTKKGIIGEGTIPAGSTGDDAIVTKTLTWDWPYETTGNGNTLAENDEQDTNDGKTAGKFKVTYKIDAVQVEPTVSTPAP